VSKHLATCTKPAWTTTGKTATKLIQRCRCNARRTLPSVRCPGCSDRPFEQRGCDVRGCYMGSIPAPSKPACCYEGQCEDVCGDRFGKHFCGHATPEQLDAELADMLTPKREHKPLSAATKTRLAELDSGVGYRSGQGKR
jgi:hypothetical protein